MWATNPRQSKHLLLQPVLAERPQAAAPLAASPGPFSLLPGSWGPRGIPGLTARVRPSASQPWGRASRGARHPARGQRSLPPRAGRGFWGCVKGLVWHPPPGLRGPEPESRRRTPSPPGSQSGAPSVPQRRAPAQPAFPESTARPPLPSPSLCGRGPRPRPALGELRASAPPMEEPELPALRGGSRGRGRGRPRGSTLSAGPRPSGAPASRVRSGARAELAREEAPRRGPGPPTRRSPAGAGEGSQALRCPEGAVAAS